MQWAEGTMVEFVWSLAIKYKSKSLIIKVLTVIGRVIKRTVVWILYPTGITAKNKLLFCHSETKCSLFYGSKRDLHGQRAKLSKSLDLYLHLSQLWGVESMTVVVLSKNQIWQLGNSHKFADGLINMWKLIKVSFLFPHLDLLLVFLFLL